MYQNHFKIGSTTQKPKVATLQINVDNEFRGLVFAGSTPLGNLCVGSLAEYLNVQMAFLARGIAIIV